MREASGASRTHGRRHAPVVPAFVLLVLLLTMALSGSALALSQRGHEFLTTFGSAGSGNGQFNGPTGVAVNEASGDIYVVDSGNNRIERFNAKHEFVSAWGWGVTDGAAKSEICTAAETCRAGLGGHGEGQLRSARSIAVDSDTNTAEDPSAGDVYVEVVTPYEEKEKEFAHTIIDKFDRTGQLLQELKGAKSAKFEEEVSGIAVGVNGELWVYDESDFFGFSNAAEGKVNEVVESEAEGEPEFGFAWDGKASAKGGFLAGHTLKGSTEPPVVVAKEVILEEISEQTKELEKLGVPVVEVLDPLNTTGVASDQRTGDAYVDNGTKIAAFDTEGQPIQTLGEGHLVAGAGVAADAATEEVLVADQGGNAIVVFQHEEPAAPTVDELSAANTTATGSTLEALIDPHGTQTSYAFRYGTGAVPKAGEACSGACTQIPASPAEIPVQFGHREVKAELAGLSPATLYHYRVFAEYKSAGQTHFAEASTEEGGELTFTTQLALLGEVLPDGRHWELVSQPLKNGAAIQDMPSEGGLSQASADGTKITYVAEGASSGEGEGPEGNRSPEMTQLMSLRSTSSWLQQNITTKHNEPEGITPGFQEYQAFSEDLSRAVVVPFGSELVENPPLSGEATERTAYVRHTETCLIEPSSCFQPLVNHNNVLPETKFGAKVSYVSGNPSLTHIAIHSTIKLTAEQPEPGTALYDWSEGSLRFVSTTPTGTAAPGPSLGFLFSESDDQRHAISDDGSRYVFTSSFASGAGETLHILYLRSMGQANSIRLDVPEAGVTQSAACASSAICEQPAFQEASANGSTIFFTDQERLTKDAGATHERPDLYACDVKEEEVDGTMQVTGCRLTDLSAAKAGESGNVQGNLIGASEDGSIAYFVANGALAGSEPGNCHSGEVEQDKELHETLEAQEIATSCGLYVERRTGETWSGPELVQRLSGEDEYDWGTSPGSLLSMVSRVSPDGEWLSFMSDRNLTGYNTRDRSSGRPAEEVYLYNASTKKTICASCNPTGARPNAILDQQASGQGIGLLADRGLLWTQRRLAANIPAYVRFSLNEAFYQSRFLSNEGRLFFNSVEGLVPQDKNGKMDVYQFEPANIATGGCQQTSETFIAHLAGCVSLISTGEANKESAFLDASESGQDVFFVSPQQIVPADKDTSYDVYDASICSEPGEASIAGRPECIQPPAASPPLCDEVNVSCREDATGPAPSVSQASEGASSGNDVSAQHEVLGTKTEVKPTTKPKPLTRAQKLKKALASCKKLKKKSKRHACEVSAKKKYGAKKAKKSARAAFRTAGHRGRA